MKFEFKHGQELRTSLWQILVPVCIGYLTMSVYLFYSGQQTNRRFVSDVLGIPLLFVAIWKGYIKKHAQRQNY